MSSPKAANRSSGISQGLVRTGSQRANTLEAAAMPTAWGLAMRPLVLDSWRSRAFSRHRGRLVPRRLLDPSRIHRKRHEVCQHGEKLSEPEPVSAT